jgi:predicted exporter
MAAHVDHQDAEPTAGAALLPIFAIAVVVATIAICFVIAAPSTVALIVALGSVIGFGAGIVALLSRLIGPDEH